MNSDIILSKFTIAKVFKICLILMAINLIGCNSKKENKSTNDVTRSLAFEVKVRAIVKQDDTFSLFYTTGNDDKWSSKHLIKTQIVGSDVAQDIVFKLKEEDFPAKIRLDLGTNVEQQNIDLYKLSFSFGEESMEVREQMISKYFICNKYAEYEDENKADIILKEVDEKYNPLIIATDYFMNRIDLNLYK